MSSALSVATSGITVAPSLFFDRVRTMLTGGAHLVTFYGRSGDDADGVVLTAVVAQAGELCAVRTSVSRDQGFHSMTRDLPQMHIFERELYEQERLKPHDHPWLKPVRFSGARLGNTHHYPFYMLEGKEVHEVAVGPIHAGVIEPGHFRFMCLGETVHHLEVQLGFQHRDVETELRRRSPWKLAPLVETIAGDTSVAHTWAYARAIEALSALPVPDGIGLSRGIALELERVAMHLATLSGICNDIAFLAGAATYGRLRTSAINLSMLLCGSRFGRGWIRPGGSLAVLPRAEIASAIATIESIQSDIAIINDCVRRARSVNHRLVDVGTLSTAQATELGVVGLVARASGIDRDTRTSLMDDPYVDAPIYPVTATSGDCHARATVRMGEIDRSLNWLIAAFQASRGLDRSASSPRDLSPSTLSVAVCEGFRGEVVHALETDALGQLRHYKVQDPSLRNWFGLAVAARGNEISDFPLCNKSFDLSYCGNDL